MSLLRRCHHRSFCAATGKFFALTVGLPPSVGRDGLLRRRRGFLFADDCRVPTSEEHPRSIGGDAFSSPHASQLRWRSSYSRGDGNARDRARIQYGRDGSSVDANADNRTRIRDRRNRRRRGEGRGPAAVDMRDCGSIEEVATVACDRLDDMSPREISAFWTIVSRFVTKNDEHHRGGDNLDRSGLQQQQRQRQQQLAHQMNHVFSRTMESMGKFGPRELAQTSLGLARIVNVVDRERHFGGTPPPAHQILHNLLVGGDSRRKEHLFRYVAEASTFKLSRFDAQCLCNLAYACAIADCVPTFEDGSTLFDHVAQRSIPLMYTFRPQTFSNMVWSFERAGRPNRRLFEEAARHVVDLPDLGEFKPQELSNTLLAYAKAEVPSPGLYEKVADEMVDRRDLGEFKPQELSNILWAFARAGEPNRGLFAEAADHVVSLDHLNGWNSQDLFNTAWAFAKAGARSEGLFRRVGDDIARNRDLARFGTQGLSNTAWAFAKAGETHPQLFTKLRDYVLALNDLGGFSPQELSNLLWSLEKVGACDPGLFEKAALHITSLEDLDEFLPQELSNILLAFSKAGISNPVLFKKVADHVVALESLASFHSQALSNTLWAFANVGERHSELFQKVANHVVALDDAGGFNPQEISNLLWAFAKCGESHPMLFGKAGDRIVATNDLGGFSRKDLSISAWAYATANIFSPILFKKISGEVIARRNEREFDSRYVAQLLWSFAAIGHLDADLFSSLDSAVANRLHEFNGQGVTNVAWAYAVANIDGCNPFDDQSAFIKKCIEMKEDLTRECLAQLHQWSLWQRELNSEPGLPATLEEACREAFTAEAPNPSAFQKDVAAELGSLGLDPKEEVLLESGYRVDALVEVGGRKIGVEVDGPSHFAGRKPLGRTILKRRQVARLDGIELVSVPYWEWTEAGRVRDGRRSYLGSLLGIS